ncbi:putative DNA binding domain-containing protein [Fusobacterium vincentii]|uniref:DNA binding domain-containing protein n=1 Tax=Fusobacterium nucleatum TaxID=851 RepID=A0AAX3MBS3_FUSNU|nr:RNA-binding domain-containing protein [Fusobacterium nucleatum]WDA43663.1 putative DNA binding domain-containing protein [Fusobacterium nucleatum]
MDNKIKLFVSSPENQYLERKSARVEPFDILKHLVAFANADGGSLVIGVEDNGEVTGFNTYKAHKIEEFKNIALIKLKDTPIIPKYETFNVKNKMGEEDKILVISVEPTYDRVIKSYDNNVYLRQFDKTEKLNYEQIIQLEYDRGQRYFEDEVVEDTSIEDIDFELLESYRKNMDLTNSTLENILKSRNFIKKDF